MFDVPIDGWKASASLSTTEQYLRNAAGRIYLSSNQAIATTGETTVTFDSSNITRAGLPDLSNNGFTVVRDGLHVVMFNLNTTLYSAGNALIARVKVNGTEVTRKNININDDDPSSTIIDLLDLNKDDLVTFTVTGADGSYSLVGGSTYTTASLISLYDLVYFSVYGETDLVESSGNLASYSITTGQWGDLDTFTLTPGTWDLSAIVTYNSNGATTTTTIRTAFAETSGNSLDGGAAFGIDYIEAVMNNTSGNSVPLYFEKKGVTVTESTTYYLKGSADNSITNLRTAHVLYARKIK